MQLICKDALLIEAVFPSAYGGLSCKPHMKGPRNNAQATPRHAPGQAVCYATLMPENFGGGVRNGL
jgi:hypothetical protein